MPFADAGPPPQLVYAIGGGLLCAAVAVTAAVVCLGVWLVRRGRTSRGGGVSNQGGGSP